MTPSMETKTIISGRLAMAPRLSQFSPGRCGLIVLIGMVEPHLWAAAD